MRSTSGRGKSRGRRCDRRSRIIRIGVNKAGLLALADHMEALDPALYDQTRPFHGDGLPSCLLAHMVTFFGDDADPRDPRAAREAAERILEIKYGITASLYHGRPFGQGAENPTPREAANAGRERQGRSLDSNGLNPPTGCGTFTAAE